MRSGGVASLVRGFVRDGYVVIATTAPERVAEAEAGADADKTGSERLIGRTMLSMDGDSVTVLEEDRDDLWDGHIENVRRSLRRLWALHIAVLAIPYGGYVGWGINEAVVLFAQVPEAAGAEAAATALEQFRAFTTDLFGSTMGAAARVAAFGAVAHVALRLLLRFGVRLASRRLLQ